MKNPGAKLALNLTLFAAAAGLMCIGVRWLFFLGLALMFVSGFLSVRPRPRMGWFAWLGVGLLGLAAGALLTWLSSGGREPFPLPVACASVLGVGISEFYYWRASRRAANDA
jgi:hypothetical protein